VPGGELKPEEEAAPEGEGMKVLKLTDLFCGAGGTSTGAMEAIEMLGYAAELTAINHWPVAIATHTENHPRSRHFTTSIDNINPRDLYREGELDMLWASPECTHHSVARGGKPINDQSRATAWCVVRWAEALRPNVILVENVPEFLSWGGIGSDGRPLKKKKGETFLAWKAAMESLGYRSGYGIFCAADYGDPTTRKRLFVQFVRGKRRVVWPTPTHAAKEVGTGKRLPWVPARAIIDWTLPGQSIYARKKPLSEKTMARIMAGLRKFGLKPFIVEPGHGDDPARVPQHRTNSVEEPLRTVPGSNRFGLAEPFMVQLRGTGADQINSTAKSLNEPVPALTAGGGHLAIVDPYLVQVAHGNGGDANGNERRARSIDESFPTVCGTRGEWALCEPGLLPQQSAGVLRPVSDPAPTVAAAGAIALVEPFIVPIDHTGGNGNPSCSLDRPLSTVTTENRHAVVMPFLTEYYGNGGAESVDEPLNTVTTKQRFGLVMVEINGQRFVVDIRFRMLQPHELAAAQGFRRDYIFTGTKTDQVKQIGNAVPRRLARALCLAALSQREDISQFLKVKAAA